MPSVLLVVLFLGACTFEGSHAPQGAGGVVGSESRTLTSAAVKSFFMSTAVKPGVIMIVNVCVSPLVSFLLLLDGKR